MRLKSLTLALVLANLAASGAAAQEEEAAPASVEARFEQGVGLVIESSDEQFGLTIRARGQVRAELTHPEEPEGAPGDPCRPAPLSPSTCLGPGRGGASGSPVRGSVDPPQRAGTGGTGGDAGRPGLPGGPGYAILLW